jgi:ABC-type transport system substrate-binding protein
VTIRDLVWPVASKQIRVSWDPDAAFSGSIAWAPAHTVHLAHEPVATIPISIGADGVRFPDASQPRPRLAESWSSEADGALWTVKLRRGVRSSAGNELRAEDVAWGWKRAYALRGLGLWRSRRVAGIRSGEAVDVVDDHTVRFLIDGPNPTFPAYLAFSTMMAPDSTEAKRHVSDDDPWASGWLQRNPVGYGPMVLERHDADSIVLRARDDYWAGPVGLASVTQLAVERREHALRMLERGEATFVAHAYPEELARFAGRPGFTIHRVRANHASLHFGWRTPPFDDVRVRHAVAYALPWERVFSDVYRGHARPCRSLLSPATAGYSERHWPFRHDPAHARALLREAGHGDGFATELWVGPTNECIRFGEVLRAGLAAVGIVAEVRIGEPEGSVPLRFQDECGHAITEAHYDLAHDIDPPTGMRGVQGERDPAWGQRLKELRAAPSAEKGRLLDALQRDLVELCATLPIAEIETGWIARGDIDPWAIDGRCVGIATTVWGSHRWDVAPW